MNSYRSSIGSNNVTLGVPLRKSSKSKQNTIDRIRNKMNNKLATKYCTCQNYMRINQINRTIAEKQCILKSTLNDIRHDQQEQKLEQFYKVQKSQSQLHQLIEYYKYYSQKSVLFIKQYFSLLFHYQEKRKFIEYKRLKVLLDLSDSSNQNQTENKQKNTDSFTEQINKQPIGQSRNLQQDSNSTKGYKGYKGINILDELEQSKISNRNQHQESLLINRLRNNLSKHIGPTNIKNLSIEQLDRRFDFQKKTNPFHTAKYKNSCFLYPNGKQKKKGNKSSKLTRQQTHTNTPDECKNMKGSIRRRSAKRNNSCQNLTRISVPKNPYESYTNKLRRKKNLSMDNLDSHLSTPYIPLQQRKQMMKMKRAHLKTGQRQKQRYFKQKYFKQKQNTCITKGPQTFMESITDLKNKIKREKEKLLKANNITNFTSPKRQKVQISSISTANKRLTKKNYQKLRQKTVNNFH